MKSVMEKSSIATERFIWGRIRSLRNFRQEIRKIESLLIEFKDIIRGEELLEKANTLRD